MKVYQPTPFQAKLGLLYGPEKTGKTTLALGLPKPMVIMALDESIDRAIGRYLMQPEAAGMQVLEVGHQETMPYDSLRDIDPQTIVIRRYNSPLILPGQNVWGYQELWEGNMVPEFIWMMEHPTIESVVVDTGGIMWTIAHTAQLQRAQANKSRERLSQIEYSRPNEEMRRLLGFAKLRRKSVLFTHHEKTRWVDKEPAGITWDGWSHLGRYVDYIMEIELGLFCRKCQVPFPDTVGGLAPHARHKLDIDREVLPNLTMTSSGLNLSLTGLMVRNPTYQKVQEELLKSAIGGVQ